MFPRLFETAPGTGPGTYGLFIGLALSAAFLLVHLRAPRVGFHPDKMIVNYVAAAVGGLVGARFLYVLSVVGLDTPRVLQLLAVLTLYGVGVSLYANGRDWAQTQLLGVTFGGMAGLSALAVGVDFAVGGGGLVSAAGRFVTELVSTGQGGFAFYGGVIGGAIAVLFTCGLTGLNGWKAADLAAPAVVLGLGVGRMGCFFAGCCHGAVAPIGENPVGLVPEGTLHGQIWLSEVFPFVTLEFHDGVGRLLHETLYPTQLWSAVVGVSLAAFLAWFWTHRRFDGQVAALMLVLEPPTRAFIESFRADHRGYAITFEVSPSVASWLPGLTEAGSEMGATTAGLTTSQFLGGCMVVLGLVLLVVRRNAGREPEVSAADAEEAMLDELIA